MFLFSYSATLASQTDIAFTPKPVTLLKYDAQNLKPRPFAGVSLIQRVPKSEYDALALTQVTTSLKKPIQQAQLDKKVIFVSDSYYHITTFDLINDFHRPIFAQKGYDYETVKQQVIDSLDKVLQELQPLTIKATTKELKHTGHSFAVPLHLSPQDQQRMQLFRQALNTKLIAKVPGYELIHGKHWSGEYAPHITLAYFVNPYNRQAQEIINTITANTHSLFSNKPVMLSQGTVTEFDDMNTYKPAGKAQDGEKAGYVPKAIGL